MKPRQALRIVEAAHRVEDDFEGWLAGIARSVAPIVERDAGVQVTEFEIRPDGKVAFARIAETPGSPSGWSVAAMAAANETPTAIVPFVYREVPAIATARELAKGVPLDAHPDWPLFDTWTRWGVVDSTGIVVPDGHDAGIAVQAPAARVLPPFDSQAVRRWTLVRPHLLAGFRLNRTLEPPDAVLDPRGRVVHAEGPARARPVRDELRHRVLELDRARSSRDPERTLEAWTSLVEGRWSLVDHFDSDGRRFLVARRNDPVAPSARSLSERERQIATYAGLGHSNKRIAYTLGLAPSTVSSHLQSAMRRLGARDPAGLAELLVTPPNEEVESS